MRLVINPSYNSSHLNTLFYIGQIAIYAAYGPRQGHLYTYDYNKCARWYGCMRVDSDLSAPTLCATGTSGAVTINGSHICHSASGDLEIKSVGGDLDITTWLRMRSGSNSTIKGGWHHSTGRMCLGGDAPQSGATLQVCGEITATGDITAHASDRRLKCNIITVSYTHLTLPTNREV